MRSLITRLSENLRVSLWWIPATFVAVAIALGVWLPRIDHGLGSREIVPMWLRTGSPEGARQLLGSLSSAMITVAGVTFSITVVGLSLASQQFGPRLLRNFMKDRGSQVIMGTFAAVHVYSLMVLRSIRGTDELTFVPDVSTAVALVLALIAIAMLIWFFHHFAASIVVERVLSHVGDEMIETVDHLHRDSTKASPKISDPFASSTRMVGDGTGYVLALDHDFLVQIATKHDLVIEVLAEPGSFVFPGLPILRIAGSGSNLPERSLRSAFALGTSRTPTQDISFATAQLVEVAVRALSPGLNDPNTAIATLDRLGAALVRRGRYLDPDAWICGDDGTARLLTHPVSWDRTLDESLLPILHFGRHIPAVGIHLIDTIATVVASLPSHRHTRLLEIAATARDQISATDLSPQYGEKLRKAYAAAMEAANAQPPVD